jgi:hypothetical protein
VVYKYVGKLRQVNDIVLFHSLYKAWPESKDTNVLNMYNIFNLQKRRCEWIACI